MKNILYNTVFFLMVGCCHREAKPVTPFARDYAVLRPQIDRCKSYILGKATVDCINQIAPLANKVIAEANQSDDKNHTQNIIADLMSAELNNLGTEAMLAEYNEKENK